MHRPYSIKIFLPAGDPDGLRTIEKSNWSGCGIVVPRSLFGEARQRKELARTGVYVLVGPPEESGLPRIYVGEGDPIWPRPLQHASKKDFWTSCIAFTSKDENLNKAHVQQLEALHARQGQRSATAVALGIRCGGCRGLPRRDASLLSAAGRRSPLACTRVNRFARELVNRRTPTKL